MEILSRTQVKIKEISGRKVVLHTE